jgi:hypothetical protein
VYPGNPSIALVSDQQRQRLPGFAVGDRLRCGGYRYTVAKVHGAPSAQQVGLALQSEYGIRPGMVLRLADEPLADDELASMLGRLTHILHTLTELDAETVFIRLTCDDPDDKLVRFLHAEGVFQSSALLFRLMSELKSRLPSLAEQRKVGEVANRVNMQLSVIQLGGEQAVPVGG